MKSPLYLLLAFFSIFTLGQGLLDKNQNIDISKLDFYKETNHPKLVVFVPSLSYETDYASMLTSALSHYFIEKLAFENYDTKPTIDVILVVNDKSGNIDPKNLTKGFYMQYDPAGIYFKKENIPVPQSKSDDSQLFFLNDKNKVVYSDLNYRGQGEHLKPLENIVKKTLTGKNDLTLLVDKFNYKNFKPLKNGDKAPKIDGIDFNGKYTVLSFYPAAFSGILPDNGIFHSNFNKTAMSCAVQIATLDENLDRLPKNKVAFYAISSSTSPLLDLWESALNTKNIKYFNDPNYIFATGYGAYKDGYSNRYTFIIDDKGSIIYTNSDYSLETEDDIYRILYNVTKK